MDDRVVETEIVGVLLQPLKLIQDERGAVMHMMRVDSPTYKQFGEVYFSEINTGIVKAWKRHQEMTQHFVVPSGKVRFVIYDDRSESPSCGKLERFDIGRPDQYQMLVVPPMVWYGFQSISSSVSIVANCSDIPHDPMESEQCPIEKSKIPYDWH